MHTANSETVEQLLSGLLGREVTVAEKPAPKADSFIIAGFYRNGDGTPVAACLSDLPLAAYAGAALSLFPPAAAKDCVAEGEIDDEDMQDNFYEVLNVCSRVFAADDAHRVTLDATYFPPDAVNDDHAALVAAAKQRKDLEVEVDGYGKGRLALVVL